VVEHTALAVEALATLTRPTARPMAALGRAARLLAEAQRPDGSWAPGVVARWDATEGYASSILPVTLSLRAIAAYRAALGEHLPRVPKLVRAQRLAAKARAGST